MDLQTRKLHFIEEVLAISNEEIIEKLELVLKKEQQTLNPVLKEKLTSRARKANEDIGAGRVYTREEVEAKIRAQKGL